MRVNPNPEQVWELGLAHMDRVNRHHFCVGGCKTHTRRSYRLVYSSPRLPRLARPLGGATPDPKLGVGVGAGAGGGATGASARGGEPIEARP